MTDWFTSDPHFGHRKIIEYQNRPFADVGEMNDTIIQRWNERVRPGDTLYILGDFAFGTQRYVESLLGRIVGNLVLVDGNHDSKKTTNAFTKKGHRVVRSLRIPIGVQNGIADDWDVNPHLYLRHKPGVEDNDIRMGQLFRLCGHVHSAWTRNEYAGHSQINVGVDVWNYYPHTLYELLGGIAHGTTV